MESSKGVSSIDFCSSIPVENVQSLASKNLNEIPSRYLHPELDHEQVLDDEGLQIPVIDMNKLVVGHFGYEAEIQKLHLACRDYGFFQLINHGASDEIKKMKKMAEEFFKLPLEVKMLYAQKPNSVQGYGQLFVASEEQKLDWGDMLFLVPRPLSSRNINIWPDNPSSFRPTLDEFSAKLQKVSINLANLMAENLKVDPQKFSSMFHDGRQGIRMNYYPPCVQSNNVLGLAPHSDSSVFTLLIQVNDVEGLQIKNNQKWLPIKPISEAIIVNVGDSMEVLSNGEYRSIEHRAVVHNEKERLSIAAFQTVNMETNIGPLPEIVKEDEHKYKTMEHEDFIKLFTNRRLDGKSFINQLKL